jgi:O-antigen/teichoic acid export membrane protein
LTESRVRPILLLLSGNLLGAAVGGTFFLIASWRFSLAEMGRYAVAISVQWVVFGLVGTGLAIATLRLARDRLATEDRAGAAGIVTNAALSAGGVAAVAAAVAFAALGAFASRLAITPQIVALAVLWAGARAVLDILRSGLLAQQDFRRAALLTGGSAATGLAALAIALGTGELTVQRLLSAHAGGLFAGALVGIPLLLPLGRGGVRRHGMRPLLEYARWPAMSEGTRLLQTNLGPPILVSLAGATQAGLFGMGRYPAYVFDVIAVSLYQYWLAKAVQVPDQASMRGYIGRQLRLAGTLGIAMVASAFAVQPFLPLLGENFARAGLLFVLSSVDFALILLVRPMETVFHGLRRPRLELAQRTMSLPILFVAAWLLAPRWGAVGMAGAHISASVMSLAVGALLLRYALRSEKGR